jgi:hypothetical protein
MIIDSYQGTARPITAQEDYKNNSGTKKTVCCEYTTEFTRYLTPVLNQPRSFLT